MEASGLVGCLGSAISLAGSPRHFQHEGAGVEWEGEIPGKEIQREDENSEGTSSCQDEQGQQLFQRATGKHGVKEGLADSGESHSWELWLV